MLKNLKKKLSGGIVGGSKFGPADGGFTLVELIIVIAIIGVLAGAVLVVLNPAQLLQEGRDAQRLEDMDSLNKAITLALADGEIVLTDTSGVCATCTSSSANPRQGVDGANGWVKFTIPTGLTGLGKYVSTLPTDPSTGTYSWAADGTNYEINAVLEAADNATKMSTDGGDAAAVYEIGTDPALDLIN